jgi:hypothetical protein
MHDRQLIPTMLVFALACGGGQGGSTSFDTDDPSDGASEGESRGPGGEGGPAGEGGTEESDSDPSAGSESDSEGESGESDTTVDPPACAPASAFDEGITPTAEVHVSPSGSDGGGCGAESSPCASLDFAISLAAPGTAIRLHAGTYGGGAWIEGLAGTAEAPIWIGGVEGEARPVFEGGPVAFTLRTPQYVVVHDLEVQNTEQDGINIDDGALVDDPTASQFVVVRNIAIRSVGTGSNNDCLKLSGLNEFVVMDSDFSGCGGGLAGSGIDMVGCHNGVVRGNLFHDMVESGNAVQTKGGSENVEIRGNRFEDAGSRALNLGGSTGFEYFRPSLDPAAENAEARNIRAIANVLVGSDSPIAFVGCTGCLAAHNTIVNPRMWVFRVLQETPSAGEYTFAQSGNNRVVNNIVYFQRGGLSTVMNVGGDTAPQTFTIENNLWFAHDAPEQSDPAGELPVAEASPVVGSDPMLVDPAGGDVHVMDGSPAIGAGVAVVEAPGDYEGTCYGDPPTIGAWAP